LIVLLFVLACFFVPGFFDGVKMVVGAILGLSFWGAIIYLFRRRKD
jgi:hypothetical protein